MPFAYALDRDAKDGMDLERALALFDELGEEAAQAFRSMLVFDAVVMNPDRRMGNYGVLRDNETGRVLGFAPVFGNNLALLPQYETASLSVEALRERLRGFTFDASALRRVRKQPGCPVFSDERLRAIEAAIRENAATLLVGLT